MSKTAVLLFALIVLGFGTAFSLNALAVSEIPPLWVATIRASVACVIFIGVVLARQVHIPFGVRDLDTYALIGATTGIVPFFLLAWGQRIVPSSLAGVLFASVPLMTVFLSWGLFAGDRPTMQKTIGAMLGLAGVTIAFPGVTAMAADQSVGAAAILFAAVSYAFGGLFLQRAWSYDPFALMAGQFLCVSLLLTVMALMFAPSLPPVAASLPYISAFALGATGSALPLLCFLLLVRRAGPVVASSVTFFIPFVAVGIGIMLLSEPASLTLLIGFGICAVGSLLVLAR